MRAPAFLRIPPGRWVAWPLAACLLAGQAPAHADLWAYVDEQGITHFAAEQISERYQLFFKGSDLGRIDLVSDMALAGNPPGSPGAAGDIGLAAPRHLVNLQGSRGFRAALPHIEAAARGHAVDQRLLQAVIAAESGFDPQAVSPKGAVGLMQLLPSTAEQYGVLADPPGRKDRRGRPLTALSVEQKLTDPRTNVLAGTRHLAYLMKRFNGTLELVLAACNAGEGAVQRAGNRIPNYQETQAYVKTVLGLYQAFKPQAAPGARAVVPTPVQTGVAGRAAGRVRVVLAPQATGSQDDATRPADSPVRSLE